MNNLRRYLIIIIVLVGGIFVYRHWFTPQAGKGNYSISAPETANLNRNETRFIYTKHARCRMDCRHIEEQDVKEILRNGEINYSKSDLQGKPDPKYALEGRSSSQHRLRIIFAPTSRGMVVITCIDLDTDWYCNCS